MKLFFFSGLILVCSLSLFHFSYRLNHIRLVFLSLTRSTFVNTIYVEETNYTPRFMYQKTVYMIEEFFTTNIHQSIEYQLDMVFINLDTNLEVMDNSANQVLVYLSCDLIMNYQFHDQVRVTLIENHA